MKQELVKQVVKVGNTAGVLVPRDWLDGKAKIVLLRKPLSMKEINEEVFVILAEYLADIKSVILAGSYARGEQDSDSDVEIIAISEKTKKKINRGRFTIFVMPEKEFDENIDNDALPLLPMLLEGKFLLNETLAKRFTLKKITKHNIKWIVETTESALNIVNSFLELDKENLEEMCDYSIAYSLILRMRGLLIIKACKKNKILYNEELRTIVKRVAGSDALYYQYRSLKNNKKSLVKATLSQAIKIYKYNKKLLEEVKKYE